MRKSSILYALGFMSIPCILTAGTIVCFSYIKEWNEPSFAKTETPVAKVNYSTPEIIETPDQIESIESDEPTEAFETDDAAEIIPLDVQSESNVYSEPTTNDNAESPVAEGINATMTQDIQPYVYQEPDPDEEVDLDSMLNTYDSGQLSSGQTWEVPNQFRLTINSIQEIDYRFPGDNTPFVYKLSYTYENTGFNAAYYDGLYITTADMTIVDSDGEMGKNYYEDESAKFAQSLPIGARCTAETNICTNHRGIKSIGFSVDLGNGNRALCTYVF